MCIYEYIDTYEYKYMYVRVTQSSEQLHIIFMSRF